jgi:hypothetical protein
VKFETSNEVLVETLDCGKALEGPRIDVVGTLVVMDSKV